jgi:hypothetical protein
VAISMVAVGKPEENGHAERLMRMIRFNISSARDASVDQTEAGNVIAGSAVHIPYSSSKRGSKRLVSPWGHSIWHVAPASLRR